MPKNDWEYTIEQRPDIGQGNGNFVEVRVVTERGLIGRCMFGSSGAPGEPQQFGEVIETKAGRVRTEDKIMMWKY